MEHCRIPPDRSRLGHKADRRNNTLDARRLDHEKSEVLALSGHTCLIVAGVALEARADGAKRVEFNRDVRPILSENCFSCHGPDKGQRKADSGSTPGTG